MKPITKRKRRSNKKPNRDLGTPELQQKRAFLQNNFLPNSNRLEQRYTESMLGLLWLNGHIDKNMYNAGDTLRSLHYSYSQQFGIPHNRTLSPEAKIITGMPPQHVTGIGGEDTPRELHLSMKWTRIHNYIYELGHAPYRAIMHISIHSSPYENLAPHTLRHGKHALFQLDNWLRLGKHDKLKEKDEGK